MAGADDAAPKVVVGFLWGFHRFRVPFLNEAAAGVYWFFPSYSIRYIEGVILDSGLQSFCEIVCGSSDGLMRNDVVKSDVHSTDSHGLYKMVFAVTHLLGFEFAPRIKGLGGKRLYAFKHRKDYEEQGYELLPGHLIREGLMEEQWDDVLRFVATIPSQDDHGFTTFQAFEFKNGFAVSYSRPFCQESN